MERGSVIKLTLIMGLVHGEGSVSVGICFAPAEGGDEQTHWDGGRHTTHGNRAGGREGEMDEE